MVCRMCGRFIAGDYTWAELFALMSLLDLGEPVEQPDAREVRASYNIKPTQNVAVVCLDGAGPALTSARWWFVPHWHKGKVKDWKATTFNAKVETAFEKPTFRTAWRDGRCLIPANGYYEWTGERGRKQPHWIGLDTNAAAFFFAGLMSQLPDGTRTCTILTRPAAPQIAHLHPRMPVILSAQEQASWLRGLADDETVIADFGTGWEGRYRTHSVRRFGIEEDGPELAEPDGFGF